MGAIAARVRLDRAPRDDRVLGSSAALESIADGGSSARSNSAIPPAGRAVLVTSCSTVTMAAGADDGARPRPCTRLSSAPTKSAAVGVHEAAPVP